MRKIALGVFFFYLFILPNFAKADTYINGAISSSTTWSPDGGAYVIDSNFSVPAGVTLTIQPGTIIKAKYSGAAGPSIYGKIIAHGTNEALIYFTSFDDDTKWQGLYFKSGSEGDFDYVDISRAGNSGGEYGNSVGIENDGGILNIQHSHIHDNYKILYDSSSGRSFTVGVGIYNKGTLSVSDSVIENHSAGIYNVSGTTTASHNIFKNNSGQGIFSYNGGSLTLTDNTFSDNGYTAHIDASEDFAHSGNISNDISERGFEISGTISKDTTWNSDDLPILIYDGTVTVPSGVTLSIAPGTIIKLGGAYGEGSINISGNLIAKGTEDSKIYFTSQKDGSVGGDSDSDGTGAAPAPQDWDALIFEPGSKIDFDNVVVRYGGLRNYGGWMNGISATIYDLGADFSMANSFIGLNFGDGIFKNAGTASISGSEITDNIEGIQSQGGSITISGSSLHGNADQAIYNQSDLIIDARNNWWGDASGPRDISTSTPTGVGDRVSQNVLYIPFLTAPPSTTKECCSNVLFLPGLEASRLYKQKTVLGLPVEDQLWEPNAPSDVVDLYMNSDGLSKNLGVYTKDIIDVTNIVPIFNQNIYKDFITELNGLVSTNKISDWKPYAYDWRQGIDDLIQNGTKYNNNQIISLVRTLQSLVDTSKTGKVTIIAHSNGGLLAKALIKKLEDDHSDLINHIDTIILVASPQLGTPNAFSGLLHGYNQNILNGFLMSETQARILAQNMPSAYGLLPSQKYFEQAGVSPLAVFTPTSAQIYKTAYGSDINNYMEEHNFVLGQEGRTQPTESDLISPIKGNSTLLTQAENLHNSIDNMTFPSSIKVMDIAGWGKETITGMTYTDSDIQPIYTIRGDETVVIPSALYGQGTKYWLDLSQSKLQHSDILEDPQLLSFVTDLIQQKPPGAVSLKDAEPIQIGNRLHLSVHSPITIGVTDKNGNFTGKICDANNNCYIQENIPGSTYQEFGDGKYVTLAEGDLKNVTMQGTDAGTFTFDFEKVAPNGTSQIQSFIDIPVTTQTQAEITVNQTTGTPQLALDVTGDGKTDFTLTPNTTFDPIMYLQIMKTTIDSLDLTQARKDAFDKRVDNITKSIQKGKVDKAKLKADRFKTVLENKLSKPDPKKPKPKKLSKTDAQLILDMLNQLLDNLS